MGSENLSGAKGNSHSRLNAHFAFLSLLILCIIHYNNAAPVSDFCSSIEVSIMSFRTAQCFQIYKNCNEKIVKCWLFSKQILFQKGFVLLIHHAMVLIDHCLKHLRSSQWFMRAIISFYLESNLLLSLVE